MLSALLMTVLAICQLAATGTSGCSEKQFACSDGNCINRELKCNGVPDCTDNSDEIFKVCFSNTCNETQFQCNYGGCVPLKFLCNEHNDCWDGSDENKFVCANESNIDDLYNDLLGSCDPEFAVECREKAATKCLNPSQICDGNIDCSTGIDESANLCTLSSCPPNSFRCENGACISANRFCNQQVDCADGSDEIPDLCHVPEVHFETDPGDDKMPEPIYTEPRPIVGCLLTPKPGMRVTDYFAEFSYRPNAKVPLKTIVYIGCEQGYSNIESGFSKCGENGWSSNFTCVRVCKQSSEERNTRYMTQCIFQNELTDCNDDTQIYNTTLLVTCAPGFKPANDLSQVGRHLCNETGLWFPIDPNPKCEAICGIKSIHHREITPWTVSIFERISAYDYTFKCSGIILSPYIVLTTESCFTDHLTDSHLYYSVVEGNHRFNYNPFEEHGYNLHNISDIHYVTYNAAHKVALLNLVKPFNFGAKVRPICLDTNPVGSGVMVESIGDFSNYTKGHGLTKEYNNKHTLKHIVINTEMSYDIKAFVIPIVNDIAKSERIP